MATEMTCESIVLLPKVAHFIENQCCFAHADLDDICLMKDADDISQPDTLARHEVHRQILSLSRRVLLVRSTLNSRNMFHHVF